MARESLSRCLSLAALEPWLARSPKSARRKGGNLSHSTEVSEPRYVLSALPISPIAGESVSFPESTSDAAYGFKDAQDPLDLLTGDLAWNEIIPAEFDFGPFPDFDPNDDAISGDGWTDHFIDEGVVSDNGPIDIDLGTLVLPDMVELVPDDLDAMEPGGNENEGEIPFETSLDELLESLINNAEMLTALNVQAAGGEFDEIFPVFSMATGAVSMQTFPESIPPLEVSISLGEQVDDVSLPVSENSLHVQLDDPDHWIVGTPMEQAGLIRLAAVRALSKLVPDVPVLLTMNSTPLGMQRFVVMDGFGYPMSRLSAELDPRLSGEGAIDEGAEETPGIENDPVIPPFVSVGSEPTAKEENRQPQPDPTPDSRDLVVPQSVSSNQPMLPEHSNAHGTVLVVDPGFDVSGVGSQLKQVPDLPASDQNLFWGSDTLSSIDWNLPFSSPWGLSGAFGLPLNSRLRSFRPDRKTAADILSESHWRALAGIEKPTSRPLAAVRQDPTSVRLVQSPVTTDLTTVAVSTRHQLLPSSSQIQLRRYRVSHRQAVAAEYAEIPLRETNTLVQERLEDNAPSQLRYVVNPRAPPRGPPRSEYLKENYADNDLLERLRYSIAPRGPSLADSSSLSPGSVFFSGPRVSPVFSCQLGC